MEDRALIRRWLDGALDAAIPMLDDASVGLARAEVRRLGEALGASTTVTEAAAIVASELAHNQLRHARDGHVLVRAVRRSGADAVEIRAADAGRGIADPRRAIEGPASGGPRASLGAGLGAVFRLADEVDVDVRLGQGTLIIARLFVGTPTGPGSEVAIFGRPHRSERISGDDALLVRDERGFLAGVIDGIGHGAEATSAARAAAATVLADASASLDELFARADDALRPTRGAAVCLLRHDEAGELATGVSVGDVSGHLYRRDEVTHLVCEPGMVGVRHGGFRSASRALHVREVPVRAGDVLVMFTDGLRTATTLLDDPELRRERPFGIAQVLLERYGRDHDDATVLVARFGRPIKR